MKTNVLEIQMELEKKYWQKKKKHLQTTYNFTSFSSSYFSQQREGGSDGYIRFCFVGGTTNLCSIQPTRRPAINVVGYKSLSQSMKITFKSKKFRGNAWCGLGMRQSTSC